MTRPRDKILETAVMLQARDGLEAVSMRAVAARIGVTPMSLYRHFSDREALVDAIAERGIGRLAEYFLSSTGRPRSLQGMIAGFLEFALHEPQLYEVAFHRRRAKLRAFPDDFAARRSRAFELLRGAVEQEMSSGSLNDDDPLEVALSIWAHGLGLVALYSVGRFGSDEAAFRRIYARSFRRLLDGLSRTGKPDKRGIGTHETTRNPAGPARGRVGRRGTGGKSLAADRADGALPGTRGKRLR